MTEPLSFRQICLTAAQLVIDGCQLSGPLDDSSFERLCDPLLLAGASGLLQSNSRLVGRDTQQKQFDLGREIISPRARYQNAGFGLKAEQERRDRDFTHSPRIWNHAPRSGVGVGQAAVESLTELLGLKGGTLAMTRPDYLNRRTITRVTQPRIRKIEAQHGEQHVEQSTEDLG
jgi:hypothetical protein